MTNPAQAFLESLQSDEPADGEPIEAASRAPAADATASTEPSAGVNDKAPLPAEQNEELLQGVEALREEVSGRSNTISTLFDWMDAIGFTIGDTRVSLLSAVVLVLVLLSVFILARLGEKLGRLVLRRMRSLDPSRMVLADKLISVVVWTLAVLVGIDLLGLDLTALAVFSGALGLAVGFGLQKTFGNLIAGIILLMDRSIKPGDVISVSDSSGAESFGQIRKIGIRAISVITRDRTEYLIPNEMLMVNQVVNWSYSSRDVRVKAPVGVSYNSDIELVTRLLYQAADETKRVLKSPKPRVNIMEFGDSSVNFELRFWISDPEDGMANIRSDIYRRIWHLFAEHNIEIPFPQRDLNLRDNEQFQQLVAAISQRIGDSKGSAQGD